MSQSRSTPGWWAAAGIGVVLLAARGGDPVAAHKRGALRPNIVLILADDLGYGDLGCYGQKLTRTPSLDRLAAEGIRFTDFYAGSTVCAPSRASLMTGQHQGHAYIRGNSRPGGDWRVQVPLRPRDLTVAEALKAASYRTALIGKWGLGDAGTPGVPNHKGFDSFFGYLDQVHAHDYYPSFLWRDEEKVALPPGTYSSDLFTREALAFLRQPQAPPFFLYLAYTTPHSNNAIPNGGGMQVPSDEPYTREPWPQPVKNRAAMITRMDRDIGEIVAAIDAQAGRDTVIFFSSDNGPAREGGSDPAYFDSGGPLRGIKRDLYEGGIRVPFIARWKGRVRKGQVRRECLALWDVFPTAAELAGLAPPTGLDGISFVPTLLGLAQRPHDYLYWEFHERGFARAVRQGRFKLLANGSGSPLELYDLDTDVGERDDLAALFPDRVRRLEAIMDKARVESAIWTVANPGP